MSQLSFERNVQTLGVGKYLPKNKVLAKDIEMKLYIRWVPEQRKRRCER